MDAAIASMKESRKEFAALLSKTARKEATKERNAQKRKEKKEAVASGAPFAPKERTSAWQAFSAGDEVHGVLSAMTAYKPQYDAWLLTQPNAKRALTGFAKFARTADFGREDYAALEARYKVLAAERKSAPPSASASTTSSKRKGKLTDEEKEANKAARHAETLARRAAKAAEKAAETPAKAKAAPKAAPKAPVAPSKPVKGKEEKPFSSSSSSPQPKKKLVLEDEPKAKAKAKAVPKPKAKAPPPPKEEDEVKLLPYKYEGRSVLRTEDNYLFEKGEDGDFGDYIGLLDDEGEVDTEAPNPFAVEE